ncbi:MAG TPA: hypothetical protein VHO28_06630 [Ignavibacteriales bacterium]|nr:hypothetical protein [Ignavibacteriales bacterium]
MKKINFHIVLAIISFFSLSQGAAAQSQERIDKMISYYNSGVNYESDGYVEKAMESYKKALTVARITIRSTPQVRKIYCMSAINLGNIYLYQNNLGQFYKYYKIAAQLGDEYAARALTSHGFSY